MKIIIMHARNGQVRRLKLGGAALAALLACGLAAAAGAGALLQRHGGHAALPEAHAGVAGEPGAAQQPLHDAAFARETVNVLAAKVGDLQARAAAVEGLGRRVAQLAGVAYSDPELAAGAGQPWAAAPAMDDTGPQAESGGPGAVAAQADGAGPGRPLPAQRQAGLPGAEPLSAEELGRRLDLLLDRLALQADGLSMLDAALTRRGAEQARLPTTAPVADYPYLTSSYGWRRNPVTGRYTMHEGLDFAAPPGTPIVAATGGVVTEARRLPGYGNTVEIDHGDGVTTRYAHAQSLLVRRGDLVARGQPVATVGTSGRSTGPHLHFEVRMAGQPVDPTLFLAGPPAGAPVAAGPGAPEAALPQGQVGERRVR